MRYHLSTRLNSVIREIFNIPTHPINYRNRLEKPCMSILSHDSFWNAVITMPMTKKMLQLSLKKCSTCGRTVLEAALDDYAGKTDTEMRQMQRALLAGYWFLG